MQKAVAVGIGRRKTSIARVMLFSGSGKITANDQDFEKYFMRDVDRLKVKQPLVITSTNEAYDITIKLVGGGNTGQSEASRLGIARALIEANPKLRKTLKQAGFLTRDSRMVERKKYGRPKARKRFQFSKR